MKYDIVIGVDELDKYGTKINFANKYIKFGEDIMEEGLKEKEDEQEVSTAPNKVRTSITDKKDENKEVQEDDTGNEVDVLTTQFEYKKMRSVASQTMDTDERKEGKKRRRRNRKKRSVTPIQVDTSLGQEEKEEEEGNLDISTAPQKVGTNMTEKEVEILDEEEAVVFEEEESEKRELELNMCTTTRHCESEEETSICPKVYQPFYF
uniref:rRNA-processing protein EBP2-like n=1 Tax=Diabrotica virgifera virgifera TaxID=50390 RepID=A0A6P7H4Z7_DIAVI